MADKRQAELRVDGDKIEVNATPFQQAVILGQNAKMRSRTELISCALVCIAFAICDLADAIRERQS